MKINAKLIDANEKESKRQYTLCEAMALVKNFLKRQATIIIESDGGRVELHHAQN